MADKKFFKSIKRRRMINIMKYMYIYVPSKKTDKYNNRLVDKKTCTEELLQAKD